jgi:hypothetical protein
MIVNEIANSIGQPVGDALDASFTMTEIQNAADGGVVDPAIFTEIFR